ADDRQAAGGTSGFQIVFVAVEEVLVGEHGQARGAAFLIALRNGFRLERVSQDALAGRCLFDLGNHRRRALLNAGPKCIREAPSGWLVAGHGFEVCDGCFRLALVDFLPLAVNNPAQNGGGTVIVPVGHLRPQKQWEKSASSDILPAARPEPMASSAISTPALGVSARPAI